MDLLTLLSRKIVDLFGGVVSITKDHALCHAGSVFMFAQTPDSLAGGAYLNFLFEIPIGVEVHIRDMVFYCNKISELSNCEVTGSYAGVGELTPVNFNQASKKRKSAIKLYSSYSGTPTITPQIAVIQPKISDAVKNVYTGDEEFIYGAGVWLLRLLNTEAGAAGRIYFKVRWYEEEV